MVSMAKTPAASDATEGAAIGSPLSTAGPVFSGGRTGSDRGRSPVVGPVDVDSGAVTALFPRRQMGSPAGDPD
jgi:hypothetical protein